DVTKNDRCETRAPGASAAGRFHWRLSQSARAKRHVRLAPARRPFSTNHERPMQNMAVEPMAIARLRPYAANARTHSKKQIRQIANSIKSFGFTNPVLISDDGEIIAGHGRVEAARLLGWDTVPTLRLSHLTPTQRQAYVLADNKLALNAGWDHDVLAAELQALIDLDFDVEVTGFSAIELPVDKVKASPRRRKAREPDAAATIDPGATVTMRGDVWLMDGQRLFCADACNRPGFQRLLDGDCLNLVLAFAPDCCDRIVRCFEQVTGKQATLGTSGE